MNDVLITINGEQGCGKTTLLRLMIEAIADAGLLSVADTKWLTENPSGFFQHARITNSHIEQIEIAICPESLLQHVKALDAPVASDEAAPAVSIYIGDLLMDRKVLDAAKFPRDVFKAQVCNMIDSAWDTYNKPPLPLTINIREA